MRIMMITDFYWPFLGGLEQMVRILSAKLVAHGHEVSVVTQGNAELPAFEVDQGVRIYRLRGTMQRAEWLFSHPERTWTPPFPDPELTWGLRRIIARERPEIVHGHDWLARSFLPLKRWSGAKFVMCLHYYPLSCATKTLMYQDVTPCTGPGVMKCLSCASTHYGRTKGTGVAVANWAMGAAERAAVDMYVPCSTAAAEGNSLIGSGLPFEIIPNFVSDPSSPPDDVDQYLSQLPQEEYLLFVGALLPNKGINVLLRAYEDLANPPPLVLIGTPWPTSPTSFPPNVIVRKDWPNYAVMAARERSIAALVPSIWREPFGIVVIEGMMSARPVIASRVGGIPDIVVDRETGILVPPGDTSALRRAMERLLADPALCVAMGQAGKERVAMFRADAVVPRFERMYAELLDRGDTHVGDAFDGS